MSKLNKQVIKIIKQNTEVNTISEKSSFAQLGMDSLSTIQMAMDIEDEFGIEFTESELPDILTVGDLIEATRNKLNDQQ